MQSAIAFSLLFIVTPTAPLTEILSGDVDGCSVWYTQLQCRRGTLNFTDRRFPYVEEFSINVSGWRPFATELLSALPRLQVWANSSISVYRLHILISI